MSIHYQWPCPFCDKVLESRRQFQKHKKEYHYKLRVSLTTYIKICYCQYCNKKFNYLSAKSNHEKYCKLNPNHIICKGHPVSEETKNKIRKTNSIRHVLGGYRKRSGRGKKGWYKGYFCDSSWELAYVIYNIDHCIKFERNKKTFKYTFNGKELNYLPDFIIDGKYVEIKGYWNDQWQAKLDQFPKEEHLEIISENEIKPYLEYVITKYGKNFIDLYEKK